MPADLVIFLPDPSQSSAHRPQSGHALTEHPTGQSEEGALRLTFDRRPILGPHSSRRSSDAASLAHRKLDDALGLTDAAAAALSDSRRGKNTRRLLARWLPERPDKAYHPRRQRKRPGLGNVG
jgi:hypothetical protein